MAHAFIESLRSRQDRPRDRESGGPEADSTGVDSAAEEGGDVDI